MIEEFEVFAKQKTDKSVLNDEGFSVNTVSFGADLGNINR